MGKAKVLLKALGEATKKKKKPSSTTQRGVKFAKNKDIKDQVPSKAEQQIDAELRTAKVAKGSRSEKITTGRSSVANFIKDQMSVSPGMAARRKQDEAFRRKIANAKTKEEKELLRNAFAELRKIRKQYDEKAEARRRRNISRGSRGKKRKEVDNFAVALKAANETGELIPEFDKLTKNQQRQILQSAKRKLQESDPDEINKAILEKRLPKDEDVKVGRAVVGTRSSSKLNKGGMMKKGIPVITVGIGMMPAPKGKKPRTGSKDFRNGGMVTETKDNLNPGLRALKKVRPDVVANILKKK
jgi:hypothetical protein